MPTPEEIQYESLHRQSKGAQDCTPEQQAILDRLVTQLMPIEPVSPEESRKQFMQAVADCKNSPRHS